MDDQEEIINKLTERIRAEQETAAELRRQNDLAEQSLKVLQKSQQLERQRNRLWLDISEQTANLVQQLPGMALILHGYNEKLEEFDEHLKDTSKRLDRIEYALMLLLSGKGNGNRDKTRALIEDIDKDRKARLIEEHKRMLHELEMKRAGYGRLNAPPHILIEIDNLKSEIEQLEGDG